MNLTEALEILDIPWPRDNKLSCPTGHQNADGRSTPSLHLYDHTDSFYCFSCTATGDAYGLLALFWDKPIAEVLAEYGEGYSGDKKPVVSKRRMYEAAIAAYQDWLADYWPRLFRAASEAGVPREEAADHAMWLADQLWDGPLTVSNIPEGRTPAQLSEEIDRVLDVMEQTIVYLQGRKDDDGVPRAIVQPEVQHPGGHSGGSLRESEAAGQLHQVRVGQAERDDAQHVDGDQAPARLLHRRRLSGRGGGVRKR